MKKIIPYCFILILFINNPIYSTLKPYQPWEYSISVDYSSLPNNSNQFIFSFERGLIQYYKYKSAINYYNVPELSFGLRINNISSKLLLKTCLIDFDEHRFYFLFNMPIIGVKLLSYDNTNLFDAEVIWMQMRGCFNLNYYCGKEEYSCDFWLMQHFKYRLGITLLNFGKDFYSGFNDIASRNLLGYDAAVSSNYVINWKKFQLNPEIDARGFFSNSDIYFLSYKLKLAYSIPKVELFKFRFFDYKRNNYLKFIFGFDYQKAFCGKKTIHNRILNLGVQYHFAGPWEEY